MAVLVVEGGWSVAATAERFQVDPKTVRKWVARSRAEGEPGLEDSSSRPHRSPNRTPRRLRRRVCLLRRRRRWGPARIGAVTGLSAATVRSILCRAGLNRLDCGDGANTAEPAHRYQRERAGELVHIDVKKLAAIPDGGGWRAWGIPGRSRLRVGYRYLHSAIDDRTRLAYTETLDNQTGAIAAGFLNRARAWFAAEGSRWKACSPTTDPATAPESGLKRATPTVPPLQDPPLPAPNQRQGV
jgi:transposase